MIHFQQKINVSKKASYLRCFHAKITPEKLNEKVVERTERITRFSVGVQVM